MGITPIFSVRKKINPDMFNDPGYYHHIKLQIASEITSMLLDKIDFRSYTDPNNFDSIFEGSVVAMSKLDYEANYGNVHQRRGIADGTKAIMQNGDWKVLREEPKKQTTKEIKTAVDYLTSKMNELRT